MAGIDDIIGALLRDIANSRVTADMYSRNISRYYEQDPVLRRFPVPRMEVDSLEMDLKFAISNAELDPLRTEGLESRLAVIFERQSDALTVDFVDSVVEVVRKNQPQETTDMGDWYDLIKQVWSGDYQEAVNSSVMRYLEITQRHLIDSSSEFNKKDIQKEIKKIFLRRWKYLIEEFLASHDDIDLATVPSENKLIEAMNLDKRVEMLEKEVKTAIEERGGYRLDVDVDGKRLEEYDTDTLCSVKVKTKIRNYNWTLVEGNDEESPKYILNPE